MQSLEDLRVLIVDDQKTMRELLAESLRRLGVKQLVVAEDGLDAIKQLKGRIINLVLLDVEMPRLSGEQTLAMIREDPELRSTPVIMVTGRADAEFVRRIASLGVDGYLVKPVSAAALLARIEHVARKIA
jgi:two-component system chemotaxis response regulator CheY